MKKFNVLFWTIDNDEDIDHDWDVIALSENDAIHKVKNGAVKGPFGQSLPRNARNFSARLIQ